MMKMNGGIVGLENFLDENYIFLNCEFMDKVEALTELSNRLHEKDKVKESFKEAILEREKNYPTGLLLNGLNVAVPHADPEHVINPTLEIATLENPVNFKRMDDPSKDVDVSIMFVFAVNNPDTHLSMLQETFQLMQMNGFREELMACKSSKDAKNVIEKYLKEIED